MRFLLLNQFYPPDGAPTGVMLQDLAKVLVARGHEVGVICSRAAYDGIAHGESDGESGVTVHRIGGSRFRRRTIVSRFVSYGMFALGALRAGLAGKTPDRVVSLTTPPFLGIIGKAVARARRARHIHWTMDVYPDALRAHWRSAGRRTVWRGLEWLGRVQFRGAALIIAPGSYVARRLQHYVSDSTRLASVPLWATDGIGVADDTSAMRQRSSRGWSANEVVFMYSGNMGLGHRFEEFLEAAKQLGAKGPRWAYVGDGPRRQEIEAFRQANPDLPVELLPPVPGELLGASLASADVHLVSVTDGWEGIMVPSKLQNAFGVGRPVLFLGREATEAAAWIRDSGGGWVVPPGDLEAMLQAVREAGDAEERHKRGRAALQFARVHFSRQDNCNRIADLLEAE